MIARVSMKTLEFTHLSPCAMCGEKTTFARKENSLRDRFYISEQKCEASQIFFVRLYTFFSLIWKESIISSPTYTVYITQIHTQLQHVEIRENGGREHVCV